jgi:hypothetical protein
MQITISKRAQREDPQLLSGGYVPRSGNYTPLHSHSTGTLSLLKNNVFPKCEVCGLPVQYAVESWVRQESASTRFRLLMHTRQPMSSPNRAQVGNSVLLIQPE